MPKFLHWPSLISLSLFGSYVLQPISRSASYFIIKLLFNFPQFLRIITRESCSTMIYKIKSCEHKVNICPCVSSLWRMIIGDDRLCLSLETNHSVSMHVQHVAWLCWCLGVVHRSIDRHGESKDVLCRWSGSGEGRTCMRDQDSQKTDRGGWHLGYQRAREMWRS